MLPRVFALVDAAAVQQDFVLTVRGDQPARSLHAAHGLAHAFFLLHAAPVVGEGHGLGPERRKVAKLAAPALPQRDAPVGMHPHRRVPVDHGKLLLQVFRRIGRRIQVRHGAHVGVSPTRRGQRAAFHALLIKKARLPKMHMNINKTRYQQFAR